MKDVNWGDMIMRSIIVSVIMASAAAVSYLVFHILLDQNSFLGIDVIYVVMVAVCIVSSLLVIRIYPGPKSDFGPAWAWVLLFVCVPALGTVGWLLGSVSPETISEAISWWLMQLSALTLIIMMSIYLHTHDSTISMEEAVARDF